MSDTSVNRPRVRVDDRTRLVDETGSVALTRPGSTPTAPAVMQVHGSNVLAPVIEIDRLWDALPGTSSNVVRAIELLKQTTDNLLAAQRCDDPVEADHFVQRVQLTLPRLFSCRSIGDGFAVVINALHFAFVNLHGTPLTPDQLAVILRVVKEVRARPTMSLDQGVKRIEELEEHGLEVDPPDFAQLLEKSGSLET